MKLRVFDAPCRNCLFSPNRIVSDEAKKEILETCLKTGKYFVCHKASERDYGEMTCCNTFFNLFRKQLLVFRLAEAMEIIEWIPKPELVSTWTLQPQEQGGSYRFEGRCYATKAVKEELTDNEIEVILEQIRKRVNEGNGADYLQVFICQETRRKIYVIDNLSDKMLNSDAYSEAEKRENNYFTIMFAEEY